MDEKEDGYIELRKEKYEGETNQNPTSMKVYPKPISLIYAWVSSFYHSIHDQIKKEFPSIILEKIQN